MKKLCFIFLYELLIVSCTNQKQEIKYPSESIRLYSEILDTVITENFYHLHLGEDYRTIISDYWDQKSDSIETAKSICRIKEKYKQKERCIVVIINEFQFENDLKTYYSNIHIQDFYKYIPDTTEIPQILNCLTIPSYLKPEDLKFINFIEFKSFDKDKERHFLVGRGIGTIAVSQIYFSHSMDQALLYYEFYCGGKCGKGEVLLLDKINNKWRIKGQTTVWVS